MPFCGITETSSDAESVEVVHKVSSEISGWYKQLAEMYGCMFLDAAKFCTVSPADGVHLDVKNQRYLGEAVYRKLVDEGFAS